MVSGTCSCPNAAAGRMHSTRETTKRMNSALCASVNAFATGRGTAERLAGGFGDPLRPQQEPDEPFVLGAAQELTRRGRLQVEVLDADLGGAVQFQPGLARGRDREVDLHGARGAPERERSLDLELLRRLRPRPARREPDVTVL